METPIQMEIGEKVVKIFFLNGRSVNLEKYWSIKFQIEHLLHNICTLLENHYYDLRFLLQF